MLNSVLSFIALTMVSTVHAQSLLQTPLLNYNGSLRITGEFNGPNPNPLPAYPYHAGVDMVSGDTRIQAVAAGTVALAQENLACPASPSCGKSARCADHGLGNSIIIRHTKSDGKFVYSLYGHMANPPTFKRGDPITFGQDIGTIGGSANGCATGVPKHLHWELKSEPVLHNPSGSPQSWGYTEKRAENYGYFEPIAYSAIDDIRKSVDGDRRFSQVTAPAYTYPEWDPDWTLATLPFIYTGQCACLQTYVWVYQATWRGDSNYRYTIWFNPETNAWTGWTPAR